MTQIELVATARRYPALWNTDGRRIFGANWTAIAPIFRINDRRLYPVTIGSIIVDGEIRIASSTSLARSAAVMTVDPHGATRRTAFRCRNAPPPNHFLGAESHRTPAVKMPALAPAPAASPRAPSH